MTAADFGGRPPLTLCPTCESSQPHLHPTRAGCPDPFHEPIPATLVEWRREVARWADLLATLASGEMFPDQRAAVGRIVAEMRREIRESES